MGVYLQFIALWQWPLNAWENVKDQWGFNWKTIYKAIDGFFSLPCLLGYQGIVNCEDVQSAELMVQSLHGSTTLNMNNLSVFALMFIHHSYRYYVLCMIIM